MPIAVGQTLDPRGPEMLAVDACVQNAATICVKDGKSKPESSS